MIINKVRTDYSNLGNYKINLRKKNYEKIKQMITVCTIDVVIFPCLNYTIIYVFVEYE